MRWLAILLLSGCAQWTQAYPPSQSVEWVQVHNKLALHNVCAMPFEQHPTLAACAFQIRESGKCFIYSIYTEDEATRVSDGEGRSLKEHELKHCKGMRH